MKHSQTFPRTVRIAGGAALLGLALAGCNTSGSGGQTAQPTVRAGANTAPADLQLLCASTAAQQLQVEGDSVLPINSGPSGGNAYQVTLTVPNGQAVCIIDNNGMVQSVTPA
ncbi:hypothetical protein JM93_01541 [Roseibium hamelinense]|uniref:Peptidase inhibitor I78 family protein n=1 Tax=Roseibium hamelinense TaxID=150831 RepID=A0A562TB67_9HYPH|nr:hypothetical protein [Roseibium hamelinense]MTI42225.1 hypothetical protein [Roseibium hamelinense]TWI90558.1 hypothetical protein JM93_01541 [Roseibium hamelinense]